ncbi:MAG: hypothetical protein DRJ64_08705 [Thermoprotei archaeon]|nr:MAG: hypothetical protein DRJ64_08705 [Thermoprotei archaeon]
MPVTGYDLKPLNVECVLDLPFSEGTGTLVHDIAKPHHVLTQEVPGGGSFNWGNLASGCPCLEFAPVGGGVADGVYLRGLAADTTDLDFTTGDYSIVGWFYWVPGVMSQMLAGRYVLDNNGWELYLYDDPNYYLSIRHNHAGGTDTRSGAYSSGWAQNTWHFMGISRVGGGQAVFYRNGMPLPTTSALEDPETCNQDFVMGARFTKNSNWFSGMMGSRWRFWTKVLSDGDHRALYDEYKCMFN